MSRFRYLVAVACLGVLILLPGAVAGAQEQPAPEPTSEQQGVPEPAVSVVPDTGADEDEAWTTVYLVPTALLIGAGTVILTIVMYFFRVTRARYRPQE